MKKVVESKHKGVFLVKKGKRKPWPATKSVKKGFKVYGEEVLRVRKEEFRVWEPKRSKLSAAILKGLKRMPIKKGDSVLYLGAASGTTASHVSDLVGKEGVVFCVEFSPRVTRDLVFVCEQRRNMLPMLANAQLPETYSYIGKVDVVYQDIAQPNQADIFLLNVSRFLKREGFCFLCVKARSINVAAEPKRIFEQVRKKIGEKLKIIQLLELSPYERDHAFILAQKRE